MATDMNKDIVPFGKYRGQPLEAMASDRQYVDWLMAQSWFRERYKELHTTIINNFQEPSETPEHNALQVLFLDHDYRVAFVKAAAPGWMESNWKVFQRGHRLRQEKTADEFREANEALAAVKERMGDKNPSSWHHYELSSAEGALNRAIIRQKDLEAPRSMNVYTNVRFEKNAIDVDMEISLWSKPMEESDCDENDHIDSNRLTIEIKPSVSDDYPSVLRQMIAGKTDYLFIESYTGVGATVDQFRKVFKASGKRVVFRHEVEALLKLTPEN